MSDGSDSRAATQCPECGSLWICIVLDQTPTQDFGCTSCRHEWTATF